MTSTLSMAESQIKIFPTAALWLMDLKQNCPRKEKRLKREDNLMTEGMQKHVSASWRQAVIGSLTVCQTATRVYTIYSM